MIVGRPQHAVRPGMVIADKYRIESELGRGGFGIVFRAIHLSLDQVVAIKVLTAGEGGEAEWREDAARFRREGQAMAALRSEHVVRVLDVDVLESGNPYMVMEYLEGENLHALLHHPSPLAPLAPRQSLSIGEGVDHVVQILAALGEAHAAGIVHRDLKPANVFVTKGVGGTPVVKVLDFGVSKMGASGVTGTGGVQPLTKTGAVIGTVAYMAPEQMLDAKRVDARADLWSVAIILHELLTRTTPFGPQNGANLVATMLTKPPTALSSARPDAPRALDAILARCLEKEAEKRYATAGAVASALAPFATPRAHAALDTLRRMGKPTGHAAPAAKHAPGMLETASARRMWTLVALVGAAVTILLLGILAGVLIARR